MPTDKQLGFPETIVDEFTIEEQQDWSPPEDEESILVCNLAGWPTPYDDNVDAKCDQCGCAVYHRPHVPKGLIPVCAPCAIKGMYEAKEAGEEISLTITPKTYREVKDWLRRQKQ